MPNTIAYTALIIWPLYSLYLFKRKESITAVFITIVGGYLLLPVKVFFDFPLIPPLDKESIVAVTALIGCIFVKKIKTPLIPKQGIERFLIIILLLSPLITVLNNQERIYDLDRNLPGLTYHDAISMIINQYIVLIPFILGLRLIKTHKDVLKLFQLLVISCLLYSVLILFEIRMSPQLHSWLYGFFPHSFGQTKRMGGFRAVVFLGHGLLVAIFIAIALGAAASLWKEKIKTYKFSPRLIVLYFLVLLLLSKSVGALVLGFFLLAAIGWMPAAIIKKVTLTIIIIVIFYPALSILELFPHQELVELASSFDVDRAQSLEFRFAHEARLLERAQEKLFFGWGGWGRNRLSDSVTDGFWLIQFGSSGLFGFLSLFGLFTFAVWKALKASSLLRDEKEQNLMLGFSLIVTIILIDQLLNASLNAPMFLIGGALLGRTKEIYFKNKVVNKKNYKRLNI